MFCCDAKGDGDLPNSKVRESNSRRQLVTEDNLNGNKTNPRFYNFKFLYKTTSNNIFQIIPGEKIIM